MQKYHKEKHSIGCFSYLWYNYVGGGAMVKLTEKQKRFCDYFIESGSGIDAAIKAGYSKKAAKNIACENMTKPYIKAYIDKIIKEKDSKRIATQDEVLRYLTTVMRGELTDENIVTENIGDFMSEARIIETKVKPKDRNKAAEMLSKRYGLDKPIEKEIDIGGVVFDFTRKRSE